MTLPIPHPFRPIGLGVAGFAAACIAAALALPAQAQSAAELFKDADLTLGAQLIAEHKCDQCHARTHGNDGKDIYRPKGRIDGPGPLRGMVEACNTKMSLGLFPDDTTAVAAVLNRDHYRFK